MDKDAFQRMAQASAAQPPQIPPQEQSRAHMADDMDELAEHWGKELKRNPDNEFAQYIVADSQRLIELSGRVAEPHAVELIAQADLEDDVYNSLAPWFERVGVARATQRQNRFAADERIKNGVLVATKGSTPVLDRTIELLPGALNLSLRAIRGAKKLKSAPNILQRTESFVSNYETEFTNPVELGEIDPASPDGQTHGFVEFYIEEGVQAAGRVTRRKVRNGSVPFRRTGPTVRCGARLYIGTEDGSTMTKIGEFEAPFFSPAELDGINGVDTALQNPGTSAEDRKKALDNVMSISIAEGATAALTEIGQLAAMAEAERQRQAQAAAAAPPPAPPTP